jgi:putative FmdB family regulatory protein
LPIYEFYCTTCHTIFNFLSRSVTPRRPSCPRCGRSDLERRASAFAISKGRREPDAGADAGEGDVNAGRLERAMEQLARESASIDEDDPQTAARFMRRLYDTAGLPLSSGLAEALRRMESGEDPESIEADLGPVLEDGDAAAAGGPTPRLSALKRRLAAPRVDPELHEL